MPKVKKKSLKELFPAYRTGSAPRSLCSITRLKDVFVSERTRHGTGGSTRGRAPAFPCTAAGWHRRHRQHQVRGTARWSRTPLPVAGQEAGLSQPPATQPMAPELPPLLCPCRGGPSRPIPCLLRRAGPAPLPHHRRPRSRRRAEVREQSPRGGTRAPRGPPPPPAGWGAPRRPVQAAERCQGAGRRGPSPPSVTFPEEVAALSPEELVPEGAGGVLVRQHHLRQPQGGLLGWQRRGRPRRFHGHGALRVPPAQLWPGAGHQQRAAALRHAGRQHHAEAEEHGERRGCPRPPDGSLAR